MVIQIPFARDCVYFHGGKTDCRSYHEAAVPVQTPACCSPPILAVPTCIPSYTPLATDSLAPDGWRLTQLAAVPVQSDALVVLPTFADPTCWLL